MVVSPVPSSEESALDQLNSIATALPDPQRDLPRLARDSSVRYLIEAAVLEVPTSHRLLVGDARDLRSFRLHIGHSRSTTTVQGSWGISRTTSLSSISST
jgi:hypothetical protein